MSRFTIDNREIGIACFNHTAVLHYANYALELIGKTDGLPTVTAARGFMYLLVLHQIVNGRLEIAVFFGSSSNAQLFS